MMCEGDFSISCLRVFGITSFKSYFKGVHVLCMRFFKQTSTFPYGSVKKPLNRTIDRLNEIVHISICLRLQMFNCILAFVFFLWRNVWISIIEKRIFFWRLTFVILRWNMVMSFLQYVISFSCGINQFGVVPHTHQAKHINTPNVKKTLFFL